jgi:hypothetical protein
MSEDALESALRVLEQSKDTHFSLCGEMFAAASYKIYPVDLVAQAVVERSLALMRGFCSATRDDNFLCAAPLIRLQLDNLLRFYALWLVPDPQGTAKRMFAGSPLSREVDRDHQKLTDGYLVRRLGELLPWVPAVYRECCGFVHLSDKHVLSTMSLPDGTDRRFTLHVSGKCSSIGTAYKTDAARTMCEITAQILHYIYSWVYTKELGARGSSSGSSDTL